MTDNSRISIDRAPKKKMRGLKISFLVIIIGFFVMGAVLLKTYQSFKKGLNIQGSSYILYIPSGSSWDDLVNIIDSSDIVDEMDKFVKLAEYKHLDEDVRAGRYEFTPQTTLNDMVNTLRIGNQKAVKVTFNNYRIREDLAGKISYYLEADSLAFLDMFNSDSIANLYGFNYDNFTAMYIPNTYEIYWTTTPAEFAERMNTEFNNFWNEDRLARADEIGFTPIEISIISSIVIEETKDINEMSTVAGLYINRLNRGMKLQADPTVKYALKEFDLKRVLNKHLEVDSKYNTYMYKGLPPGPICLTDITSLEKTLNYQEHDYIFMCASELLNGTHNFAVTNAEHERNARKFRAAAYGN